MTTLLTHQNVDSSLNPIILTTFLKPQKHMIALLNLQKHITPQQPLQPQPVKGPPPPSKQRPREFFGPHVASSMATGAEISGTPGLAQTERGSIRRIDPGRWNTSCRKKAHVPLPLFVYYVLFILNIYIYVCMAYHIYCVLYITIYIYIHHTWHVAYVVCMFGFVINTCCLALHLVTCISLSKRRFAAEVC